MFLGFGNGRGLFVCFFFDCGLDIFLSCWGFCCFFWFGSVMIVFMIIFVGYLFVCLWLVL